MRTLQKLVAPIGAWLLLSTSCMIGAQDQPSTNEPPAVESSNLSDVEQQYLDWANSIIERLEPQTGVIELPNGKAQLEVSEDFMYFSPAHAEIILAEVWGNPPGRMTEGLLMPAKYTPFDSDAWAVTIEYEQDGYVSDEDAGDIDYDELLVTMQQETKAGNQARQQQGFETVELVGWAAKPFYDAKTHKLHWAQELQFGADEHHTLNYNVRVLGRQGVLVMNFIAGMEQLPAIEQQIDSVMAMANFKAGQTYDDFDPTVDQVAAYGVGALIAGKVLSKAGLLAGALVFLKKFWYLLLMGIVGIGKLLSNKSKQPKVAAATDKD